MPLSTTVLSRPVLTVRVHAGLNAASLLAGLFTVGGIGLFSSADELLKLHFPKAQASLEVEPVSVNGIGGVTARFETPAEGPVGSRFRSRPPHLAQRGHSRSPRTQQSA